MDKVTLNVEGMKCGGCENNVKTALLACEGVAKAEASHKEKTVTVEFDSSKVSLERIKDSIAAAGFQVV